MSEILMEQYYFCKNNDCNWFGPYYEVERKSEDGLLEHKRDTCPDCGGHFFEKKLIEFNPPKIKLYTCQECGKVFKSKQKRTFHQIDIHGIVHLDD